MGYRLFRRRLNKEEEEVIVIKQILIVPYKSAYNIDFVEYLAFEKGGCLKNVNPVCFTLYNVFNAFMRFSFICSVYEHFQKHIFALIRNYRKTK